MAKDETNIRMAYAQGQAEARPARARANAPQRRSGVRSLVSKLGALLAALALAFVLMGAGPVGLTDEHAFVASPVQVSVAYAAESADDGQNANAADDVSAAESDGDAETIEDDDVPLAMAKATSGTLESVIFVGVILAVAIFVFFMYRMNRSISLMRNRFH